MFALRKALHAELAAQAAPVVPQWQPIETVPQDGSKVLVWPCFETDSIELEFFFPGGPPTSEFTHWHPLPAAPSAKDTTT